MEIKKAIFLIMFLSLVLAPSLTGASSLVVHYPDMVLYNGKVVTVDKNFSIAQAVAIRDGKISSDRYEREYLSSGRSRQP